MGKNINSVKFYEQYCKRYALIIFTCREKRHTGDTILLSTRGKKIKKVKSRKSFRFQENVRRKRFEFLRNALIRPWTVIARKTSVLVENHPRPFRSHGPINDRVETPRRRVVFRNPKWLNDRIFRSDYNIIKPSVRDIDWACLFREITRPRVPD